MSAGAAATHALAWRVSTTESGSTEWGTPPAIYAALDQEFDFTLDAAASPINAKHVRYLTKAEDALGIEWTAERVFVNPPYGRGLRAWLNKARIESEERGALVVMLIPARTDTSWFHEIVLPHAEIRFIRGRLGFTRGGVGSSKARAPFASMVAIFRPGLARQGNGVEQLLFPFLPKTLDE